MRVCAKCRSRYSRRAQFCGIDGARIVETDIDPLIGTTLDRYQITTALGEGGNGCVYRAVHTALQAEFAIKVLLGDVGSDETFVARFRREAQAASRIRSANVVSVIDFATTPEGLSYLVMEYVKGTPLDAVIRREGPLQPLRAARLAGGIASGLAAAHALGFVHRDVKPSNVLVVHEDKRDLAKLLDFGIVRHDSHPPLSQRSAPAPLSSISVTQSSRLTREGRVLGTPAYMPPEQWSNAEVGPAADLYSLGVVLFEMLAGDKPFKADDMERLCTLHLSAEPPALPPSQGLEVLAARLLAKRPEERPPSAQAVRDELEELAAHLSRQEPGPADAGVTPPAHSTPRAQASRHATPRPLERTEKLPAGTSRAWLALGAACVALVAGAFALYATSRGALDQPAPPEPPAEPAAPLPDPAAQVERALARRGLTLDDLALLDERKAASGRQALARRDAAGIAELVTFAVTAPITAELVRGRLDRLDAPLASRARALGGERGRRLEERYLGLYKELKAAAPPEREELLRRVAGLESELAAPVRAPASP